MNNFFCKKSWIALGVTVLTSFSSGSAIATPTITVTGTPPGSYTPDPGPSATGNGPRIIIDSGAGRQAEAEKRAKEKKKADCKADAVSGLELCNGSQRTLHTMNSTWCRGAYWVGGALGVAGGWAYSEGEGAGAFLLAGSGFAIYQLGEDCQTDMDRAYTAGLADCSADYAAKDNACEAM